MLSASKSGSASGASGYNLTRSLRFRASASAYLNRTPASAGNRKTWTWSAWVKRGKLSSTQDIFSAGLGTGAGTDETFLRFSFTSSDQLSIGGNQNTWLTTTPVYRDPSAWYHIVLAFDATQATATNRILFYVNGVQVTAFATNNLAAYVSNQNYAVSNTVPQVIGIESGGSAPPAGTFYLDGYLAEVNFIDGQALTPSSFGSTNALTGVWQPARYTGTYGTNGFYLPFTDNSALTTSSNVGLGKDFSGNGNYWATNNISITAGVTYDSMTDVPTLTSATASNFAVLNPLDNGNGILSNGNLQWVAGAAERGIRSTFQIPTTGLFYAETTVGTNQTSSTDVAFGFASSTIALTSNPLNLANFWGIYGTNTTSISRNGTSTSAGAGTALASGDILQFAIDLTNNKGWIGKNNTWFDGSTGTTGNPSTGANPTFTFSSPPPLFNYTHCFSSTQNVNFGQQPFQYTPPTGFVALNTYNLPTSTIVKGNTVMDATTYTGTAATLSIANAAAFKPDLVWYKARSFAYDNSLFDSVRGVSNQLVSNTTQAETSLSGVTSFNSNGFTLGTSINGNNSGTTYVAWQWQAGQGSTSSNTNGSITSTVSVNASAGFSVVTYTGTNAVATVGHGLGVAPQMIIVKSRSSTFDWIVGHTSLTSWGYVLNLDNTIAQTAYTGFNNTAPTSSVFSLGVQNATNASAGTYVAYCWTPIAGYSAFGSYTGNGSADGTFVYTGMRPRYILLKRTDSAIAWIVYDTARNTYNVTNSVLQPNVSTAEVTGVDIDVLSNGFKLRTTDAAGNASGGTYIYMAFAENPFRNALAR